MSHDDESGKKKSSPTPTPPPRVSPWITTGILSAALAGSCRHDSASDTKNQVVVPPQPVPPQPLNVSQEYMADRINVLASESVFRDYGSLSDRLGVLSASLSVRLGQPVLQNLLTQNAKRLLQGLPPPAFAPQPVPPQPFLGGGDSQPPPTAPQPVPADSVPGPLPPQPVLDGGDSQPPPIPPQPVPIDGNPGPLPPQPVLRGGDSPDVIAPQPPPLEEHEILASRVNELAGASPFASLQSLAAEIGVTSSQVRSLLTSPGSSSLLSSTSKRLTKGLAGVNDVIVPPQPAL